MEWKVVKTALIALFAAINLFLAVVIINTSYGRMTAKRETENAVIQLLAAAGITADKAVIPKNPADMKALPVVSLSYNSADFVRQALGEGASEAGEEGESFVYKNGGKTLTVSLEGFEFLNESAAPAAKAAPGAAAGRLSQMGFDLSFAKPAVIDGREVYTQSFEGFPIFKSKIEAVMGESELISFGGSWLTLAPRAGAKKIKIRPATNALMDFLQEAKAEGAEITAIDLGYSLLFESSHYKETEAQPTWRITTAAGKSYYYRAGEN